MMFYFTLHCLQMPDSLTNILCLPIAIKSRYYPLILSGIFMLLSLSISIDIVSALLIGYLLHPYGLLKWADISNKSAEAIDNWCLCKRVKSDGYNYIYSQQNGLLNEYHNQAPSEKRGFVGKGTVIGGS